jgi:hypothetical protein
MVIWSHCFGACSKAEHYGGEHAVEEAAHFMARKQREQGGGSWVAVFLEY